MVARRHQIISDVTDISLPRGRDGSFNDSFPSLRQDMLNIGRRFNLRLQPELDNTEAYSDQFPAFLIGADLLEITPQT